MTEFRPFQKIPRLSRDMVITEKLDGTNASIMIDVISAANPISDFGAIADTYMAETTRLVMWAGSRKRWITPQADNFGFARWAQENAVDLFNLGPGHHFGEWWGQGVQRGYGLNEKRFSLFNVHQWTDDSVRPACCHVVPTLARGEFDTAEALRAFEQLRETGSIAAPGYMKPEGIIIYHTAGNYLFKKTFEKDEGKEQ